MAYYSFSKSEETKVIFVEVGCGEDGGLGSVHRVRVRGGRGSLQQEVSARDPGESNKVLKGGAGTISILWCIICGAWLVTLRIEFFQMSIKCGIYLYDVYIYIKCIELITLETFQTCSFFMCSLITSLIHSHLLRWFTQLFTLLRKMHTIFFWGGVKKFQHKK